jgi:hypothetical protein
MTRSGLLRAVRAGLLCWSTTAMVACGAAADDEQRQEQAGTLAFPLSVTAGEHLYRFSYFQVYLYPDGSFLSSTGDPAETVLTAELPTGQHQASLWNWALERDDGLGNFIAVNASLVSSSYVSFEILNGSTTTVSFQFETDGEIITVGAGGLTVAAKVTERAPVCVPLGNDCGEGLWCPPAELTGAALACRHAGWVELGGACGGPADCVANSSCIDFGAGPECAALCSSADLGTACAGGGSCTPAGREYGVCAPAPGG